MGLLLRNQAPHRHRQAKSGTCRGREPPHARHTFEVRRPCWWLPSSLGECLGNLKAMGGRALSAKVRSGLAPAKTRTVCAEQRQSLPRRDRQGQGRRRLCWGQAARTVETRRCVARICRADIVQSRDCAGAANEVMVAFIQRRHSRYLASRNARSRAAASRGRQGGPCLPLRRWLSGRSRVRANDLRRSN
jgi:hypothetical protein